ncbi:10490_t:CDS:2 [Cetraspora pellucida]|uniref:10490_t:CDS:1 n=1 Tax=Cetraspora pellucida TaxID=1433469 RepID=A0A9N9BM20_9GLOM|nr:10490_t:CDS:2 [Cetraspora pellucida]
MVLLTDEYTKCHQILEKSMFLNQSKKKVKSCSIYHIQSSHIYKIKKQEINNHNDQTDNDDNQEEMILLEKLLSKLYDEICAITSNNYIENNNMGIEFSYKENQPNVTVNIESIEKLENYENSDNNDSDDLYENYELYLTKAFEIVQEQKAKKIINRQNL